MTTTTPLRDITSGLGFAGMLDRTDHQLAIEWAFDEVSKASRALRSNTITTRWAVESLARVQAKPVPADPRRVKRHQRDLDWSIEDAREAVATHRALVDAYLDAEDALAALREARP